MTTNTKTQAPGNGGNVSEEIERNMIICGMCKNPIDNHKSTCIRMLSQRSPNPKSDPDKTQQGGKAPVMCVVQRTTPCGIKNFIVAVRYPDGTVGLSEDVHSTRTKALKSLRENWGVRK